MGHFTEMEQEQLQEKEQTQRLNNLKEVSGHGDRLEYMSEDSKDDKEIVLAAVKDHGEALAFASKRLQNDRQVIRQAVAQCGRAFQFASYQIRCDEVFVLELVRLQGSALEYASADLRQTREIVSEAVKQNGAALEFAALPFKADLEIVRQAVQSRGAYALMFAADTFWSNHDIVLQAVRQNAKSEATSVPSNQVGNPDYYSRSYNDDHNVIWESLKQLDKPLRDASNELRDDKQVVMEIVRQHGAWLMWASDDLRDDPEVVSEALRQDGDLLRHASLRLRADRSMVLEAVRQKANSFQYAHDNLKNDPYVIAAAIHAVEGDGKLLEESCQAFKRSVDAELGDLIRAANLTHHLGSIVHGIHHQTRSSQQCMTIDFLDTTQAEGTAARSFAEAVWKRRYREKIWVLQQALPPGVAREQVKLILDYSDIKDNFRRAEQLNHFAPVFAAFAARGYSWNTLPLDSTAHEWGCSIL